MHSMHSVSSLAHLAGAYSTSQAFSRRKVSDRKSHDVEETEESRLDVVVLSHSGEEQENEQSEPED